MKHIGDNYYQFKCTCGENILLQGGDIIHHNKNTPLCAQCGLNHNTKQIGSKNDQTICEICRTRLDEETTFPTTHEDGETTTICKECQKLDPEGEEWKF